MLPTHPRCPPKHTFIYGLVHPYDKFTRKNVRYVGKTNNLTRRLNAHIYSSKNPRSNKALYEWMSDIRTLGELPRMFVLEICPKKVHQKREKFWIAKLKGQLLNLAHGGNGGREGYKQSSETILKKSLAVKYDLPVDKIASAYISGKSLEEVGKLFHVHINTVRRRLKEAGVKCRSISDAKSMKLPMDEIIALYKSGKIGEEIGKIYGVTSTPIYKRLKRAGVMRSRSASNRLSSLRRYALPTPDPSHRSPEAL